MNMASSESKAYIVEHLDPELEAWSSLEYSAIASESYAAGSKFYLSSVPESLTLPENLKNVQGLNIEHRSVEDIYKDRKAEVCLLDPAAKQELSPEDGDKFSVFLFGGILGMVT
jgi:ribosome biogenesis SPOUT family RNA methylase Rps3